MSVPCRCSPDVEILFNCTEKQLNLCRGSVIVLSIGWMIWTGILGVTTILYAFHRLWRGSNVSSMVALIAMLLGMFLCALFEGVGIWLALGPESEWPNANIVATLYALGGHMFAIAFVSMLYIFARFFYKLSISDSAKLAKRLQVLKIALVVYASVSGVIVLITVALVNSNGYTQYDDAPVALQLVTMVLYFFGVVWFFYYAWMVGKSIDKAPKVARKQLLRYGIGSLLMVIATLIAIAFSIPISLSDSGDLEFLVAGRLTVTFSLQISVAVALFLIAPPWKAKLEGSHGSSTPNSTLSSSRKGEQRRRHRGEGATAVAESSMDDV